MDVPRVCMVAMGGCHIGLPESIGGGMKINWYWYILGVVCGQLLVYYVLKWGGFLCL